MSKNTFIIAGLVLACLVFFFVRSRRRQQLIVSDLKPHGPTVPKLKQDAFTELEKDTYLYNIPISKGRLAVTVLTRGLCRFGDGDAIYMEMQHLTNKEMLLSLEPIDPVLTPFPVTSVLTTLDQVRLPRGFNHMFSFPPADKPKQLGLFLCLDQDHSGRCGRKALMDVNHIFMPYVGTVKASKSYKPQDKMYFFQYVYLDGDTVAVFKPGTDMAKQLFDAVLRYVRAEPHDESVDQLKQTVSRVQNLSSVLNSFPLEHDTGVGTDVQVILPYYLPSACHYQDGKRP